MFIQKNINLKNILNFTGGHLIWLTIWVGFVALLFQISHWEWLSVPWWVISVIGTAVAFYVGFKNNQAYDRLWEARKIWGAIVNSSRAWGTTVKNFISLKFTENNFDDKQLFSLKQKLIYRHIAWLYTLRNQLLIPTPWEHINQNKHVARSTKKRMKRFGIGLMEEDISEKMLLQYLPNEEYERLINYKNTATQIIDQQAQDLQKLRSDDLIDDFRHMELQNILNDFYIHQGKCERIKKFPLPRQYGGMSAIFLTLTVKRVKYLIINLLRFWACTTLFR